MPSDTMRDATDRALESDETLNLISSDKVDGTAVYNRNGDRLGTVHHLMIDKFFVPMRQSLKKCTFYITNLLYKFQIFKGLSKLF